MKTQPNWNLLTKYISKDCTDIEKKEFEDWLNATDENMAYFQQMKDALNSYDNSLDKIQYKPNKSKAWDRINSSTEQGTTIDARKIFVWSGRIAAGLIILLGLYYFLNNGTSKTEISEQLAEVINENDIAKKEVLPDGSVVWLNGDTKIAFPEEFAGSERVVELSGEAYFEVKKNKKKPFIIKTKTTITKVLGTSFNLRAYENENEVKIVVNSGKVAFYDKLRKNKKLTLTKGSAAQYSIENQKLVKLVNKDLNFNSWKTGELKFTSVKLEEVCKTLEKHYKKEINIPSPKVANKLVNAEYKHMKFEEVLESLCFTFDLKHNNDGNIVTITN